MSHTEQDLWRSLKAAVILEPVCRLTRVETGDTALGVSDVEYVAAHYNGWMETKVLQTTLIHSTFMFNTPFTTAQFQWLVEHHNSKNHLQSYLLVGKPARKVSGWEKWFMFPAPLTHRFFKKDRPTIGEVLQWPQVKLFETAAEVLAYLGRGIEE